MDILEKELVDCKPSEIAFVTFTKAGALQGIRRACDKFNFKQREFPYFKTLHSLAFNELKMNRASVMGPKHYRHFSKKMGMNFVGYYTEELRNDDDRYLFYDHLQRNNPSYAAKLLPSFNIDKLEFVRRNYKKYKDFFALYDYTDMIELYNKSNSTIPVKVAIIDEAQDLTTLQWTMVWLAFRNVERIYIAGDDDQAIYQWSGADVDFYLSISGELEILRHSYRLPESVLRYSKKITSQISKRIDKKFEGIGKEGLVEFKNSVSEMKLSPNKKYMFLSRNNCFLSKVEEDMRNRKMMYRLKGVPSATAKDVNAINTYEKVRKTRIMSVSEEFQLLPYLKKQYSLNDAWYDSFKWDEEKSNYFRDLVKNKVDINNINVDISTIHSVKGMECDNVVLLMDVTKSVKDNMDTNLDSELRVLYVGATRAKKTLTIINPSSKFSFPVI
jgi:superfamily I DNA/RNA helicase